MLRQRSSKTSKPAHSRWPVNRAFVAYSGLLVLAQPNPASATLMLEWKALHQLERIRFSSAHGWL